VMMQRVLVGVLLLVTLGCHGSWVEFDSPDGPSGSFSILMPARPTMKPSHMGTVYAVMGNDGVSYDVGIMSVPGPYRDPSMTERLFDEMQKALIENETAPTRQAQLSLGPEKYPGREIVIERKTGIGLAVFTGRAYRVKNTVFTLTVRAPADKAGDSQIKRFLESFKVRKPPAD
jgi:hypothetical protein